MRALATTSVAATHHGAAARRHGDEATSHSAEVGHRNSRTAASRAVRPAGSARQESLSASDVNDDASRPEPSGAGSGPSRPNSWRPRRSPGCQATASTAQSTSAAACRRAACGSPGPRARRRSHLVDLRRRGGSEPAPGRQLRHEPPVRRHRPVDRHGGEAKDPVYQLLEPGHSVGDSRPPAPAPRPAPTGPSSPSAGARRGRTRDVEAFDPIGRPGSHDRTRSGRLDTRPVAARRPHWPMHARATEPGTPHVISSAPARPRQRSSRPRRPAPLRRAAGAPSR